jgi:hypothetical protein
VSGRENFFRKVWNYFPGLSDISPDFDEYRWVEGVRGGLRRYILTDLILRRRTPEGTECLVAGEAIIPENEVISEAISEILRRSRETISGSIWWGDRA